MSKADIWMVLLGCLALCDAAPTVAPTISPEEEDLAQGYISQFYTGAGLTKSLVESISMNTFTQNLQAMQEFFGLEVTGTLNTETLAAMKAPRCGVPDVEDYELFPNKAKWNKTLITYRITEYTADLTQDQVDATIAQALQLYSDVIPLTFKQVNSDDADFKILFKAKEHGDFYPFDGPGGVLAHAFAPKDGNAHFDDDETWTVTQQDTNLLLVAAHEFGHALGLMHSKDKTALMYPHYQYVDTNGYRLPDDDKRGIQAIYGTKAPQFRIHRIGIDSGQSCCSEMMVMAVPMLHIADIYFTNPRCPVRALIVVTKRGRKFCLSPHTAWARNLMKLVLKEQ